MFSFIRTVSDIYPCINEQNYPVISLVPLEKFHPSNAGFIFEAPKMSILLLIQHSLVSNVFFKTGLLRKIKFFKDKISVMYEKITN